MWFGIKQLIIKFYNNVYLNKIIVSKLFVIHVIQKFAVLHFLFTTDFQNIKDLPSVDSSLSHK